MRALGIWMVACLAAACGNDRPAPVPPGPGAAPTPLGAQAEEPPTGEEPAPGSASTGDARRPEDRATLAVGDRFSCAVHAGAVFCWGDGARGELGSGRSAATRDGPVRVREVTGTAVAVAAGDEHACAIVEPGRAVCWGTRDASSASLPSELASRDDIDGVAAGGDRTCLRSRGGDVQCVERDGSVTLQPMPGPIARAVQVGLAHACTRFADGRVHCWGEDLRGETGASGAADVERIAVGDAHTCALRTDGTVRCWGDVHRDRREAPDHRSGEVERATGATWVRAGGLHTCFGLREGGARCIEVVRERVWPSGGRGHAIGRALSLPDETVEVALGSDHQCTRDGAGHVACWGNDQHGQSSAAAGDEYQAAPVRVALPDRP